MLLSLPSNICVNWSTLTQQNLIRCIILISLFLHVKFYQLYISVSKEEENNAVQTSNKHVFVVRSRCTMTPFSVNCITCERSMSCPV